MIPPSGITPSAYSLKLGINVLTQSELKEYLHYCQETGIFTWIGCKSTAVKNGTSPTCKKDGYILIRVKGVLFRAHRLAWLYVYGEWPIKFIDHVNGVRDDNRMSNLRQASQQENSRNSKVRSDNKSGIYGVTWSDCSKKWRSLITINKKTVHIGVFEDINDAKEASRSFAELNHGYFFNKNK